MVLDLNVFTHIYAIVNIILIEILCFLYNCNVIFYN